MQFVLTTWAGDKMVGFEPIVASDINQAAMYVQGVLSERTKGHEDYLIQTGARYCIDSDLESPDAYALNSATLQGTWHLVPAKPVPRLVWQNAPERTEPAEAQRNKPDKR